MHSLAAACRLSQVLQVACGGMHTVALTEGNLIFSWGVNDEGALGRETGMQFRYFANALVLMPMLAAGAPSELAQAASSSVPSHHPNCLTQCVPSLLLCAGGELWEKSGHATGKPGDAYVPGRVQMPQEAGRIVQLSTGRP